MEKEIIRRVKNIFVDLLKENNLDSLVIGKDGYFFFNGIGEVVFSYPNIKILMEDHDHLVDNRLNDFEKIFKNAIAQALDEIRLSIFKKHPTGLLALLSTGNVYFSKTGDWEDAYEIESFEDFILEQYSVANGE